MATATPLPYELYSDAPGILLNKPEWDAANAAHPRGTDFGSVPKGWPTELEGPQVWTGSYLSQNRRRHAYTDCDLARTDAWTADLYIRKITLEEVAEVDAAIQVSIGLHKLAKLIKRELTQNIVLAATGTSPVRPQPGALPSTNSRACLGRCSAEYLPRGGSAGASRIPDPVIQQGRSDHCLPRHQHMDRRRKAEPRCR
jgi:hypothetical protein